MHYLIVASYIMDDIPIRLIVGEENTEGEDRPETWTLAKITRMVNRMPKKAILKLVDEAVAIIGFDFDSRDIINVKVNTFGVNGLLIAEDIVREFA